MRGVAGTAGRFLRLPPSERRLIVEAALQLARASLELRLAPSRRTAALLGTLQEPGAAERVRPDELREATLVGKRVADVARRLPWRPTCLRQALAVQRMLRRRGILGELHLGVTAGAGATAHAWVTVAGHPVAGAQGLERYVPLGAFR